MTDRNRSIDLYMKLMDLEERYGIRLTKPYTIDSDPDEMEYEYWVQVRHIEKRLMNDLVGFTLIMLEHISQKN